MRTKGNNMELKNGDCIELMKDIPSGSVALVLTDIPYGVVNRESNGLRNLDKKDDNKQRYWITEGSLSSLRKKYGVE